MERVDYCTEEVSAEEISVRFHIDAENELSEIINMEKSEPSNEVTVEISHHRVENDTDANNSSGVIDELASGGAIEGNGVTATDEEDVENSGNDWHMRRILDALSDELWAQLVFGSLRWLYRQVICSGRFHTDLEILDIVMVVLLCVILGIIFGFLFALIGVAIFYE